MASTERLSVSVNKGRATRIREFVEKGLYPTVSSAFDAAADALIEIEQEKEAWWAEALRRCDEAEKHPEKLLDPDTFFRELREESSALKASRK